MKQSRSFVNPLSVVFNHKQDQENGFETIVRNWETDTLLKINRSGYRILLYIDNFPGSTIAQVSFGAKCRESLVCKFIERMVEEKIVLAK